MYCPTGDFEMLKYVILVFMGEGVAHGSLAYD